VWSSTAHAAAAAPLSPAASSVAEPPPAPTESAAAEPAPTESAAAEPTPSAAPSGREAAPAPDRSAEAARLFQRAQDARAAGKSAEAARLLSELLRRYPNDPRAGLAAFELGRIKLDARDPKGAVEALDQAEGAGKAFEEQVAARRVQALEESGDGRACRAAREDFLRRFPKGPFAAIVRRRCLPK
jgi:transmembrane sensor